MIPDAVEDSFRSFIRILTAAMNALPQYPNAWEMEARQGLQGYERELAAHSFNLPAPAPPFPPPWA
jgi:hypothetical protein